MARKKPVPQEPISFLARLKQHHLYGVVVTYAVVVGFLIQLVSRAFPYFGWSSAVPTVIVVLLLGFPVVAVLAWLLIEPKGTAQPDSWQRRHWKLSAVVTAVVIALVVISGFYALQFSKVHVPVLQAETTAASQAPAVAPPGTAASTTASIPAKSIAVLPFENLSTDKANAYFADGIQDLILTKLADIGDLAVISRTSTAKYASHPDDLKTIAQQLGVATILEGSVQRIGDQVLINVQLIDAHNDHHIWADSYTRTLKNVFSVEGEVAQKIAATLKAKLSPAETKRLATTLSNDPTANDLYLQGDYFASRGNINYDTAAMKQAITFYQQAIAKVPDFAQARAQLSYMESQLAWFGGGGENTATLNADALTQAEQALKLAPDLADAHLALGFYNYWGKGDYAAALKAFAAALALRPNDSNAMAAKAYVLRRQGKFSESIGVFQKALALDPRNTFLATEMATTYMAVSQYAQAEQAFQRALALDPANANARIQYAQAIVFRSGDLSKALSQMQGDNPVLELNRVWLLNWTRKYEQALTLLQSIPDSPDTFNSNNLGPKSLQLAHLYGLRGDSAKARTFYAKALPQAGAQYVALAGSPVINQALALNHVAQAELGLGQTKAGLENTFKAQAIAEHSSDHYYNSFLMERCAERYAQAGRADKAVQVLSAALAIPGIGSYYSPVMLWIDPDWDPIRKTSAFQALLKKYAQYKPAPAATSAVAATAP